MPGSWNPGSGGGGGGGATDHGALTGLADDDHTQYHNASRFATAVAALDSDDIGEGAANLYRLARRHAYLLQQTDQSITTASAIAITWGAAAAQIDASGHFSSGAPTRLTIQTTGVYLLYGSVRLRNLASGKRLLANWRANGSTDLRPASEHYSGDSLGSPTTSTLVMVSATAGAYYELMVNHNNATSLDTASPHTTALLWRIA